MVPAQRLRLGLLGPANHRAADRGRLTTSSATGAIRRGRAAYWRSAQPARTAVDRQWPVSTVRSGAARVFAATNQGVASTRPAPSRRMDTRSTGGGRLLGRYPAAVGVFPAGAAPHGLPAGPSFGAC